MSANTGNSQAPVQEGDTVRVRRTVSEADVYQFAGITGDLNRVHIDEQFMQGTRYGGRLVHGAYLLGLISTASTELIKQSGMFAVAYGHDRVRFLNPTRIGDTVEVEYTVAETSAETGRVTSEVTLRNQHGETVCVASHLLYFFNDPA